MNRKIWMLVNLFVLAALVLAACGTPATPAPAQPAQQEQPSQPEQPAAQPAEEDEVTIRWRTRPDNQEEINVYSAISKELDGQLAGIKLVYEPGGTEGSNYQDQLRTEVAAGTAPDVLDRKSVV